MHMIWVTFTSVKGPIMLNDIYRIWSKIFCLPDDIFFSEGATYFTMTIPNYILP